MRLYLRRFPGEAITVENTERQTVTAAVAVIAPPPDREGEWHQWPSPATLYAVDLDGQGRVVPVDWRRFSNQPHLVADAVVRCVRDNTLEIVFEPLSHDQLPHLERTLTRAVTDLVSIADLLEVRCETSHHGGLQIEVTYETKTGERCNACVTLALP